MDIPTYCTTDPVLVELLQGQVPNMDWPLLASDKLRTSLQVAMDQWEFMGRLFRIASLQQCFRPAIMPIISYITLRFGRVPSVDLLCEFFKCSPICTTWNMEARLYSSHCAWLRELDLGLQLVEHGRVYKNPQLDLCEGIDWIFRTDDREVKIAVAHVGDRHFARKSQKMDADVVVLVANQGNGVHTVSAADIEAKVLSISASSPLTCAR